MAAEQEQSLQSSSGMNSNQKTNISESNPPNTVPRERPEDKAYNELEKEFFSSDNNNTPPGETSNDVATNDGAVIETLDTAFHNKPGVAEGTNISGSDRADYYESRSYGKTDVEEELDAMNNEQSE